MTGKYFDDEQNCIELFVTRHVVYVWEKIYCLLLTLQAYVIEVPYIGIFLRWKISAKLTLWRCDKFSQSPIFAILRAFNGDV